MIKLIDQGNYRLVGTKHHVTILYLNDQRYVWIWAKHIGQILVFSKYTTDEESYILAQGKFKLFDVIKEPNLIDLPHLQLSIDPKKWQSYLLLKGLPTVKTPKRRIVQTNEFINK
jgi:hypothetical protein